MALTIKLVRHGESRANTGELVAHAVGDHAISLSERGHQQARQVGSELGADFVRRALVYVSPYLRARETLQGIMAGSGLTDPEQAQLRIYDDPRLREVEHGYEPIAPQEALRRTHGWFYYRFRGGESPADCYDRTSGFLEGMMRQVLKKSSTRVLIVTHGLALRCFVMRFLHLKVEEFEKIHNPSNCDVVTLADRTTLDTPQLTWGHWGVVGLRMDQK